MQREGMGVAKKEKKEKKDKKDKTKSSQIATPEAQTSTSAQAYADGTPLDRVQYLEAKLILKPDRFTSVQAFRDFGKIVKHTAKKLDIGFIRDRAAELRPEIREDR